MWDYFWGLSERQVDLLLVDQALVVYKKEKAAPAKKGKNGVREMAKPSSSKVEEAAKKWLDKYGTGEKPKISLDFGRGLNPMSVKGNPK